MVKRSLLLILIFCFSTFSKTQSITSKTLLNNLKPFWSFLEEQRQNATQLTGNEYEAILEQSYNFIELELRDSTGVFLSIEYKIEYQNNLMLHRFYCTDKKVSAKLKSKAGKMTGTFKWDSIPQDTFKLNEKQIEYLQIADRIAALGNDFSALPGDYESVVITSDFIQLNQSNHMHSRSLDHKDRYFLRDLHFIIPWQVDFNKNEDFKIVGSHYIGDMKIIFDDSSAKAMRTVGDRISKQIEIESEKYQ